VKTSVRKTGWWICLGAAVLCGAGMALAMDRPPYPSVTDRIHTGLMAGRASAGHSLLERRPTLDAAAGRRAEQGAARPHKKRFSDAIPLGLTFPGDDHRYRRTVERMILLRGVAPVTGVLEKWEEHDSAWETLTAGEWDAIGYGTATAQDGWFIFIAILARDLKIRDSPRDIYQAEQFVFGAINAIRRDHDLPDMKLSSNLARVARNHSREMADFNRFAHEGIGGTTPARRVTAAGISYKGVAENITMNNNPEEAMHQAVRDWMDSPGHRKNILDRRFRTTGVGVAVSEDGKYYFTQLFLLPK